MKFQIIFVSLLFIATSCSQNGKPYTEQPEAPHVPPPQEETLNEPEKPAAAEEDRNSKLEEHITLQIYTLKDTWSYERLRAHVCELMIGHSSDTNPVYHVEMRNIKPSRNSNTTEIAQISFEDCAAEKQKRIKKE